VIAAHSVDLQTSTNTNIPKYTLLNHNFTHENYVYFLGAPVLIELIPTTDQVSDTGNTGTYYYGTTPITLHRDV